MATKKYFTLEEANSFVPQLLETIPQLQEIFTRMNRDFPDVKLAWKKSKFNGGSVQGADYLSLALRANQHLKILEDIGCEVKGIENGLIDFLAVKEGREIYLCWKHPETEIRYWHDLDTGFSGRQPIEEISE